MSILESLPVWLISCSTVHALYGLHVGNFTGGCYRANVAVLTTS